MNLFKRYKNLWMMGVVIVIAILFIVNFSHVVKGIEVLFAACQSLIFGAMLAFILNLIMRPVETWMQKSNMGFLKKHARPLSLLISLLTTVLLIILILSIIIPNMISAIEVLVKEVPGYFNELEKFIRKLLHEYPVLASQDQILNINWNDAVRKLVNFVTNGFSGAANTTFNLVSGAVGSVVNVFIIVVFAIYVLSDKERFIRIYNFLTDLYLKPKQKYHLTQDLRIINQSFVAFVGGEIIEAAILSTMCIVGMFILRLPYAMMIGILVGVINMIPMVGAFVGGGIGAFIIFTVSPVKCLIFLIFLIVIQQIESNVFFPRIIGSKVGLPGIFVMMTIVVGGSLFGVFGMILGVPIMASVYKIARNYFVRRAEKKARKQNRKQNEASHENQESDPSQTKAEEDESQKEHSVGMQIMESLQDHADSLQDNLEKQKHKPI